jgi:RNA polymerase sigma-70 factor, ECF subfamily
MDLGLTVGITRRIVRQEVEVSSTAARSRAEGRLPGISDAQLVEAALSGEVRARELLFRRHGRAVARTVARLMGTTQDVEDVVHDTFIRAFERLERLEDPDAFRGWLLRIAVTRTRNLLRRRRLERFLGLARGDDDASLERLASPDTSPEELADLAFIDGVLRRISAAARIAWVLRVVEGRPIGEVAELCGCSESTAKRRVLAAQRRIAARVTIRGGNHG